MNKQQGVLVGIQLLAGLAAVLFGVTALLAVWDSAGKFQPLQGFLQNLGLAFGAMALGWLAAYF